MGAGIGGKMNLKQLTREEIIALRDTARRRRDQIYASWPLDRMAEIDADPDYRRTVALAADCSLALLALE